MNSAALVPVFTGNLQDQSVQLCNARDLHTFLEVGRDFSEWIKYRIEQYGFADGEDYYSPNLGNIRKGRGKPRTDYHLTLDMAKELAMVENNDKGRQVRRYFIALERTAQQAPKSLPKKSDGIPSELQSRINRRAWELSHAAYEDFRNAMMGDILIANSFNPPEKWGPKYAHIEAINNAEAVASVCEGMSRTIRRHVKALAGYAGVEYDEVTGERGNQT